MNDDIPLPFGLLAVMLKTLVSGVAASGANDCFQTLGITFQGMSRFHVRRDKAALFQWVQAPPGDRSSRKRPEQKMEFGRLRVERALGSLARQAAE
jgi:hypothetical protein